MSAWTTERPTTEGLYWYRDEQGVRFVILEPHESFVTNAQSFWCNYMRVSNGMTGGILVEHLEGEWQPVAEPED